MPSTTEKQRRFFGAVMGAKKGKKGVGGQAREAAKGMSEGQIKDFLKKSMVKKAYHKLLTSEEYVDCLRLGALTKLAQLGLTVKDFEGIVKQALPGGGGGGLAAVGNVANLFSRGWAGAQELAKLVLLAGGITAVPVGVGAHLIGRRVNEQNAKEKEMMEQLKYYQRATKGLDTGLTGQSTSENVAT